MEVKGILFDLDGTLVDTATDLCNALNATLIKNKHPKCNPEIVKPAVSHGLRAMLTIALPNIDEHIKAIYHKQTLDYYQANISKFSRYFTGIDEVINVLDTKKIAWAVVTNKPQKLSVLLLNALNCHPQIIVGGGLCANNKPHPEPVLYACKGLNLEPKNCLLVGDDIKDMQSGRAAGVKTVAVSYGYGKINSNWGYDYLIDKPQQLLKLL